MHPEPRRFAAAADSSRAPMPLDTRKLLRDIYDLAWPVLVAQLAVMAFAVIDTLMAGRYATEDLAAVGIGASIYFSVFVALMGVLLAVTPIAAQLLGAGRFGAIGEQVRQAGWLTVVLAALSVIVFSYPEPLLALIHAAPEVEAKVRSYLSIAAWGAPAGLGFRLFASYTTAVSLPRVMMVLNLAGLAVKVPLTVVFVFGHLGVPPMGAAGCALATTIVNWLLCVLAWVWCAVAADYRRYAVFARWSWPRWHDQMHLLALGLPIGMTIMVDVTAFTFMALFVARLGAVNSAAHQIAANVAALMYMLPLALGNAVSVLVGQAVGARAFRLARDTGVMGLGIGIVLAVVTGSTLALAAGGVAVLYSNDDAVRSLAALLLVIVGGYHVFDAVLVVAVSALRGYKRTVVPLACNAVGLWGVGLAGGYALGLTDAFDLRWAGIATPLGTPGFWVAAVAGMLVAAIGIVVYFFVVSVPARAREDAIRMGAPHA